MRIFLLHKVISSNLILISTYTWLSLLVIHTIFFYSVEIPKCLYITEHKPLKQTFELCNRCLIALMLSFSGHFIQYIMHKCTEQHIKNKKKGIYFHFCLWLNIKQQQEQQTSFQAFALMEDCGWFHRHTYSVMGVICTSEITLKKNINTFTLTSYNCY